MLNGGGKTHHATSFTICAWLQAVQRIDELQEADPGIDVRVITIGAKGTMFFQRRTDTYNLIATFSTGQAPTAKEAQAVADELFREFTSEEVDKARTYIWFDL